MLIIETEGSWYCFDRTPLENPRASLIGVLLSICIGCIVAKTNIHVCVVGTNVPTWLRHVYKMLDTMFQHPSTVPCALYLACLYARLYYLRKQYFLILLTKQRAYPILSRSTIIVDFPLSYPSLIIGILLGHIFTNRQMWPIFLQWVQKSSKFL